MHLSGAVTEARPTETLYFDGDRYFDDLLGGLRAAESTIDLETYIFDHDKLGHAIADELKRAARRGVRVRLLVDGFGTPLWRRSLSKPLESAGVGVKVYHPIPWHLWQHRKATGF